MIVIIFLLAIIIISILTYINSGTIIDFNIVWPLFIASFGLDHWWRNKNLTKVGMSVVYIGLFILFKNVGLYDDRAFKYFIPIFVIVMLVTYLLQNLTYSWKYGYVKNKSNKIKVYFTLFNSKNYELDDKEFKVLIAINLLGGLNIDLSNVKLGNENAAVSIYSFLR